jgi:hypothetical protein
MSCQRTPFRTLPAIVVTCVILLTILPGLFFYQTGYSQTNASWKDTNRMLISGLSIHQPRTITENFPDFAARLPVAGYVAELGISPKEEVWMATAAGNTFYTEAAGKLWHFGLTWEQKSKVETSGNLRFSTIHFADDEKTGLFGSGWNVIYKTTDNCNTWEKLPTPLSQGEGLLGDTLVIRNDYLFKVRQDTLIPTHFYMGYCKGLN